MMVAGTRQLVSTAAHTRKAGYIPFAHGWLAGLPASHKMNQGLIEPASPLAAHWHSGRLRATMPRTEE